MDESQRKPKNKPRGRPFPKGNHLSPGRPQGVRNYTNLSLWLGAIWNDIAEWEEERRVDVCKWAVTSILTKIGSLPASPGDSAQNGTKLWDMMNGLAPINPPLETPEKPLESDLNGDSQNGNG